MKEILSDVIKKIKYALAPDDKAGFSLNSIWVDGLWVIATDGYTLAAEKDVYKRKLACVDPETLLPIKNKQPREWRKALPKEKPIGGFEITPDFLTRLQEVRKDDFLVGYKRSDVSVIGIRSLQKNDLQVYLYPANNQHREYVVRFQKEPKPSKYLERSIQEFGYPSQQIVTAGYVGFFINTQFLIDAILSTTGKQWLWVFEEPYCVVILAQEDYKTIKPGFEHLKSFRLVMQRRL
jgi:hypothetical protein